jgi:hypothetical protein
VRISVGVPKQASIGGDINKKEKKKNIIVERFRREANKKREKIKK